MLSLSNKKTTRGAFGVCIFNLNCYDLIDHPLYSVYIIFFIYDRTLNGTPLTNTSTMDRGKSIPGTRGPKAKISQQLPDSFIALGAKPGSSRDDPKRAIPLPKTSVGSASSGEFLKSMNTQY